MSNLQNKEKVPSNSNPNSPAPDVAGFARDHALARLLEVAALRYSVFTQLLLSDLSTPGPAQAALTLHPREPRRQGDGDPSGRQPARAAFVAKLEELLEKTFGLAKFDGYVVPSGEDCVTRLLFCREYERSPDYLAKIQPSPDRLIEAYALTRLLFGEISPTETYRFSQQLKAPVDLVFTPKGFPKNDEDAQKQRLTLVEDVFGSPNVSLLNVPQLRERLKAQGKRETDKELTFACTKLEHYMAKSTQGKRVIAFPGDLDGALLHSGSGKVLTLLEYKSDTKGADLATEAASKYASKDKTRFAVLDSLGRALTCNVGLLFWSDTHTNAKLVQRDPRTGHEVEFEIHASSYDDLAQKVAVKLTGDVASEG